MSRGFRRFIWKKLTLEFKGLTWKLARGFRGFIGKKKFLGSKGWLAAILDYGGHWLAAIDWRPFWIVAAIFYSHSWTLNVFHRRSNWTSSPYTTLSIVTDCHTILVTCETSYLSQCLLTGQSGLWWKLSDITRINLSNHIDCHMQNCSIPKYILNTTNLHSQYFLTINTTFCSE